MTTQKAGAAKVKQTAKILRGAAAKGAGPGRPKGVPNKTTTALKEAILAAGEAVGLDGKGKGGLQGYLERVAQEDVKAFSGLLGKVLPLQVTGEGGGALVQRIEFHIVDTAG